MHAFILVALLSAPPTQEVKTCKQDRVHSPVRNASIPRIRCVVARERVREQGTLARTLDFIPDEKR